MSGWEGYEPISMRPAVNLYDLPAANLYDPDWRGSYTISSVQIPLTLPPGRATFLLATLSSHFNHWPGEQNMRAAASHRSFTVSSLDSISHPQTEVGSEIRGLNCLTLPSELQNFRWGVMMRLTRWSGSAKLSRPGLVTQNCLLIGQIKLFWASHWPSRSRLRHTWGANHKLIPEYAYNWEAMTYIL